MYYICVSSGPFLLIESTDSMVLVDSGVYIPELCIACHPSFSSSVNTYQSCVCPFVVIANGGSEGDVFHGLLPPRGECTPQVHP